MNKNDKEIKNNIISIQHARKELTIFRDLEKYKVFFFIRQNLTKVKKKHNIDRKFLFRYTSKENKNIALSVGTVERHIFPYARM